MARSPHTRKELFDLYRIALDEYRFEVRLNWDRMQYYAVVNSAIVAVGITVLKDAATPNALVLSATIFVIGLGMAAIGVVAIHRSREYYQETVLKKTVYEHLLDLNTPLDGFDNPKATLAIGTTSGMAEVEKILSGRPGVSFWRRLVRNRVVSYFMWLLIMLGGIDLVAAGYALLKIEDVHAQSAPRGGEPAVYLMPGAISLDYDAAR